MYVDMKAGAGFKADNLKVLLFAFSARSHFLQQSRLQHEAQVCSQEY